MSTRVVGYTGEGRARKPIVVDEGPSVGRVKGYVAKSSSRGYAVTGGEIVQGEAAKTSTEHVRAWRARKKAAAG